MKIRMLASFAGVGFALNIGDETDRFDDDEVKRLIKLGYAEKAPPAKKPTTKAEWDAEREQLLADRASEAAEHAVLVDKNAAMQARLDELESFHAAVVSSLPARETTEAPEASETR